MAATTIVTEALETGKSITREHGEYRAAFDGNTIGYFETHREAEMALDEHAYDLLARGLLGPAETTTDPEPEPWQCAACIETNPAERDPERPHLCRSCPETWCQVETTRRQIIVVRYRDGVEAGRSFFQRSDAGRAAADRRLAREATQGYPLRADPEELDGPQEEGGEGGPNPEADDYAAQVAQAELIAAAHQLGAGVAWWERPYLFDIDAAGARADHLLPMLASWSSAPLPTPAEHIPAFAAPEAVWPDRLVA